MMLDNENNDIYIDKKVKNFDQNYLKIIVKSLIFILLREWKCLGVEIHKLNVSLD